MPFLPSNMEHMNHTKIYSYLLVELNCGGLGNCECDLEKCSQLSQFHVLLISQSLSVP